MLALSLDLPREKLVSRFEEILKHYDAGVIVKGRYLYDSSYSTYIEPSGGDESYGIYSVENARCRPRTRLLRNALEVYDTYLLHEQGVLDIPKYQIESYISAKRERDAELINRSKRVGEPTQQIQAATVARYKKYADRMIENVCKGEFPKYKS